MAEAPARRGELIRLLQERCAPLKAELRTLLLKHGVTNFRMVPVKRTYAFEEEGVPHGEQWCLKIRYPADQPQLPLGLSGAHYRAGES